MTGPAAAPDAGRNDWLQRLLRNQWLWCAVAAGLTAFLVVKMHRHLGKWEAHNQHGKYLEDFVKIRNGAVRLRDGRPLYGGARELRARLDAGTAPVTLDWSDWYAYPPVVAVLFEPATDRPVAEVGRVWQWLNIALLPAAIFLAVATVGPGRAWIAAPLLLLAVYMWPIRFTYYQGQVEVAMLFAFTSAAWLLSRRHDLAAGAVLGFVAACKVYPAFLGLGLLVAGRIRAAAALVAAAVAVTLLGIWLTGWSTLPEFLDIAGLKSHPNLAGWPSNQSVRGFLHRQWDEHCGNHLFAASAHRPDLANVLTTVVTVGILLTYLAVEWRKRRLGWTPLSLCCAVATQIQLMPFADSYYATNLVLPLAVAFAAAADLPVGRRIAVAAALIVSIYLAGARDSDWLKEEDIFSEGRPFAETLWNNLWISRVWLGELGVWACLIFLRATEWPTQTSAAPETGPLIMPDASQPDAKRGCAERVPAHPRFASGCDEGRPPEYQNRSGLEPAAGGAA